MIVCFGSINNDLFFDVEKLKPDGEILVINNHIVQVGGKGANQAVAAAKAGAEVSFYGCVGHDAVGTSLIKTLIDYKVNILGINKVDCPSGCAVILVKSDGDHQVVYSKAANDQVRAEQVTNDILQQKPLIMLQADISMRENEILLQRAKQYGCKTILNLGPPAFISPAALHYVDYLVVNSVEAEALARELNTSASNKLEFARYLSNRFNLNSVITLGKDGAIACSNSGHAYSVGSLDIKPVDMVGAGDAFIGYLAASIDQGLSLDRAMVRASVAGGLTCLQVGALASMPTIDSVVSREHEIVCSSISRSLQPPL